MFRSMKLLRAAAAAASTVVLLVAGPPAAAEPIAAEVTSFDFGRITIPGTASTASTITCELKIDHPHDSHHVGGNANVVARWRCSAPMASLSLQVNLFYNGVNVAQGFNANNGSAFLQANAATTCVPGYYQGTASGSAMPPPGYQPPYVFGTVASPVIFLDCL